MWASGPHGCGYDADMIVPPLKGLRTFLRRSPQHCAVPPAPACAGLFSSRPLGGRDDFSCAHHPAMAGMRRSLASSGFRRRARTPARRLNLCWAIFIASAGRTRCVCSWASSTPASERPRSLTGRGLYAHLFAVPLDGACQSFFESRDGLVAQELACERTI